MLGRMESALRRGSLALSALAGVRGRGSSPPCRRGRRAVSHTGSGSAESDETFSDALAFRPYAAVRGRNPNSVGVGREALEVFGPKGTAAMTENLKLAYREDIEVRTHGLENLDPENLRVNLHEISAGPIYRDAHISVRANPFCMVRGPGSY